MPDIQESEEADMLQIEDLSVDFPVKGGRIRPVDGVHMDVQTGERHVIVGETGSGKSVLLTAILGLAGGEVRGRIRWNGRELVGLSEREFARLRGCEIAYIPQGNGSGMNPLMRNGDQIGEPLRVHQGMGRHEAFRRAVEALRRLDFSDPERWARLYPHNLSGGMRQRALVAMGTIAGGRLLLADEPTKGLDVARREEVEALFTHLKDVTLLCVSHDLRFARRIADSISVMYAGQIVETCSCKAFFENPLHPYSRMLVDSMPENGFRFAEGFAPYHHDYGRLGCRFAGRCPHARERCSEQPPMLRLPERQVQCWRYADHA